MLSWLTEVLSAKKPRYLGVLQPAPMRPSRAEVEKARRRFTSTPYITPAPDPRYGDYLVADGEVMMECSLCGSRYRWPALSTSWPQCVRNHQGSEQHYIALVPPVGFVENEYYVPWPEMNAYRNELWC